MRKWKSCIQKQGKDKENNRGVDSAKTEPSEQAQNTAPTVRKRSTFKLRAVVERITYQNPDNGYTVLKCAVKNYQDLVTVVGSLLDVNVGSSASDRRKLENGQSL